MLHCVIFVSFPIVLLISVLLVRTLASFLFLMDLFVGLGLYHVYSNLIVMHEL